MAGDIIYSYIHMYPDLASASRLWNTEHPITYHFLARHLAARTAFSSKLARPSRSRQPCKPRQPNLMLASSEAAGQPYLASYLLLPMGYIILLIGYGNVTSMSPGPYQ